MPRITKQFAFFNEEDEVTCNVPAGTQVKIFHSFPHPLMVSGVAVVIEIPNKGLSIVCQSFFIKGTYDV